MLGLNIVLTGGNSGIGFQTAKNLYIQGHKIVIGSRNTIKNQQAVNLIKSTIGKEGGSIIAYPLDLSKKKSVEDFAQNVQKHFSTIDILINNSGLIIMNREVSELNIEMTMTINHFGHFYLTYLLFNQLKKAKQARIINVSSRMHFSAPENILNDLTCANNFGGMQQYAKSKMANVQFSLALHQKLQGKYPNIKSVSLHPGVVDSGFYDSFACTCLIKVFLCCFCCCTKNSQEGAQTTLHVCKLKFSQLRGGEYYNNERVEQMHENARKPENYLALWDLSEKVYGIKFSI